MTLEQEKEVEELTAIVIHFKEMKAIAEACDQKLNAKYLQRAIDAAQDDLDKLVESKD